MPSQGLRIRNPFEGAVTRIQLDFRVLGAKRRESRN